MSIASSIEYRTSQDNSKLLAAMILLIVAAVFLRFGQLDNRPMHGDEAVNTVKFNTLYQTGKYEYDPHEFHGPLLPYATLPLGWLSGAERFVELDERFFRTLPAILGILLVLLTCYSFRMVGSVAAIIAALLCVVSPAMVFFSRYYIHEMLLVLTSFAVIYSGWRYLTSRHAGWAIATGVSLGFMHATKETCVIIWFAMAVALAVTWAMTRFVIDQKDMPRRFYPHVGHLVMSLVAALVVSVTLFTSFFTNWQGPVDSIRTYAAWVSAGAGEQLRHEHEFLWYVKMLTYWKPRAGPWFSEALIVGLSLVGFVAAWTGWGVRREHRGPAIFIAVFTFVLLLSYSLIPYKTPWLVLGPLHGMILLAGLGAASIIDKTPGKYLKALPVIALLVAAGFQTKMAYATNFRFQADARNPWVYAHPTRDVLRIERRAEQIARTARLGNQLPITVIDEGNYWPLPFYLRRFENVGYFPRLPEKLNTETSMIIAGPAVDPRVNKRLAETHHGEYFGLRPGVVISVYTRNDLWDAFIDSQRR